MKLPGRLSAAIEVLENIEQRHLPAKNALADWGRANRFAGSKDRAAIGNIVFDVLRNKSTLAWQMDDESARSVALAAVVRLWGVDADAMANEFKDDKFAPSQLSDSELKSLKTPRSEEPPASVSANMPEWLFDAMCKDFRDDFEAEAKALASRAPVDLRVNTLKSTTEKLLKNFSKFNIAPTQFSRTALRVAPNRNDEKSPNLEAEAAHGKGWFEIQDEGSQIASLLTGAKEGDQLLDYCAGAGGKTLALSALMNNKGQIHAYDSDKHRLRPIFERLKRAGCRNVQTLEAGNEAQLEMLKNNMDIVLVDAPCTGTGTWRRHPDAKWRLSEKSLDDRLADQRLVLEKAKSHVKPGGKLVYVTCSLLPSENEQQINQFLSDNTTFKPLSYKDIWQQPSHEAELASANGNETHLTLTPAKHNTDGFFISVLQNTSE